MSANPHNLMGDTRSATDLRSSFTPTVTQKREHDLGNEVMKLRADNESMRIENEQLMAMLDAATDAIIRHLSRAVAEKLGGAP